MLDRGPNLQHHNHPGDSAVMAVVTIEIVVVVIAVAIFLLANQEFDLIFAKALIIWHSNVINKVL